MRDRVKAAEVIGRLFESRSRWALKSRWISRVEKRDEAARTTADSRVCAAGEECRVYARFPWHE